MLLDRRNKESCAAIGLGNQASLSAQLYQRDAPAVLAYLRRHLPTLEDAEDLLLEVFLATLQYEGRLATLSADEQRAWLVTVARNKVIDYHRRARRWRFWPLEEARGTLDAEERMPEEVVVRNEEHDRLHTYLQRLPAAQQEVLLLRFNGGLRCSEIASVLHKREGTVRTMLSRALNTLRSFYESKHKGEL